MSTKTVALLAALLALCAALSWTNPTYEAYQKFQEQLLRQAVERMESSQPGKEPGIINKLMKSKNSMFFQSLIQSQTVHRDLVLFSLFETNIFSAQIVVLGIGGEFFPMTNVEEALRGLAGQPTGCAEQIA